MRRFALLSPLLSVILFLYAGCAGKMLPHAEDVSGGPWKGYAAIKHAYMRVIPGETTRVELIKLNFDYGVRSGAKQIDYFEIRKIFLGDRLDNTLDLPDGVRECLRAQDLCVGQIFAMGKEERKHTGNFFLDKLSIKQEIRKTGWKFFAVFLLKRETPGVDSDHDLVLYKRTPEDTPKIDDTHTEWDPLGPFTNLWEMLTGAAGRVEGFIK